MTLKKVGMPKPQWFRGRWAAFAAVCAARGLGRYCYAEGAVWRFQNGGGSWADIHWVGDGRAVLIGHDHDATYTYYAEGAKYFGEKNTNLLAGTPKWWAPPVKVVRKRGDWIGFVYGFEAGWQRALYDIPDGYYSVGWPGQYGDKELRDRIEHWIQDSPAGLKGEEPDSTAIYTLIHAEADVTEDMVAAVIGTDGWDVAAGVAAARKFLEAT